MSPGKRDLVRYREVRRADALDDQKSALDILAADATLTQEQLQELILSQLKRIIWGTRLGRWNDDFVTNGLSSLADLTLGTPIFNAACQATDIAGDLVCIPGPPVGGLYSVTRVDITDTTHMPAVGLILDKTTTIRCRVQALGLVPLGGLIPGRRYFVGFDGRPVFPPPIPAVDNFAFIQPIGLAVDSTTLFLSPSFSLTKLHG